MIGKPDTADLSKMNLRGTNAFIMPGQQLRHRKSRAP